MRAALVCLFAIPTAVATASAEPAPAVAGFTLHGGGYLQPQLRLRQDDPVAPFDENGFRVRRARLVVGADRTYDRVKVDVSAETELTPDFRMLDASIAVSSCLPADGGWRLEAGQFKTPVSRQALLSDSRLGFVDKPELASLAPDRQIGAMATLIAPFAPMVRLSAGLWNGEGINQGGNVDQNFLYAGRVELRPLGRDATLAESAHGQRFVWVAASAARQRLDAGDGLEDQTTLGGDVAVAIAGASATFEYLQVEHSFVNASRDDYRANGIVAQAAYLLPHWRIPGRVELAARWEEIDRNDTVPIVRNGDPDQSLRYFTGGLNWYVDGHDLKVQASGSHIVEVEDEDSMGRPATYANDTLLVQVTARID